MHLGCDLIDGDVVSFFHGKHSDGIEISRHIDNFIDSSNKLSKIITASSIVENRLLNWGIEKQKIIRIPIGVDTNNFHPPTRKQKIAARGKFKIPRDSIVIGSFQKDGVGWGEGLKPKLIKGPDVFLDSLNVLKKEGLPVMAFLTGPARGYVKRGLDKMQIPWIHKYILSTVLI